MTEKPNGGHAFPLTGMPDPNDRQHYYPEPGMTLRDYFAGQALAGLTTSNVNDCLTGNQHPDRYAEDAYSIADSMIAERSK